MVKGFRSPDPLQLDLMRTYSATRTQTFLKLRAPASAPFFFASMKIGAAAALVGAVVAEVTQERGRRPRRAPARGLLLRPDGADLGGPVRRRRAVGGAGRRHRPRRARRPSIAWASRHERAPPRRPRCRRSLFGLAVLAAVGGGRAPPGRADDHPAAALGDRPAVRRPRSRRSPPISGRRSRACVAGYVIGCGAGLLVADPGRPLALPAARPAAARQSRLGAADRRHRADHGDVVRLRLAVEGRGRRGDDLLPDAGERGRGARERGRDGARPDEDLRRRATGRRSSRCGCPRPCRSSSTR